MKHYENTVHQPPESGTPVTLVIGNFDGMHIGHEELINTAREYGDGELAVLSFTGHPRWILHGEAEYAKSLTPVSSKIERLQRLGVDQFYNVQFSKAFAGMTGVEFIRSYLSGLNLRRVVVGEDFHFGKDRGWNAQDLAAFYQQKGVSVIIVPLLSQGGEKISSSVIRTLVRDGDMAGAAALLGRPYSVIGTVVHGQALGRKLGYPTLNLGGVAAEFVEPKPGIYLGNVIIPGAGAGTEVYHTLISAGYRPVVQGKNYEIEAHLLDYSGDLYDRTVKVEFVAYLREELNFDHLDQLIAQMKLDEAEARRYFAETIV